MQFKIDENLPIEVAELLRQQGHDALTVPEQQMPGGHDPRLAAVCQAEARALVTLDLDWADIRNYPENYKGLIVLPPAVQSITTLIRKMNQVILLLATEPLEGQLWIADAANVRIRGGVS